MVRCCNGNTEIGSAGHIESVDGDIVPSRNSETIARCPSHSNARRSREGDWASCTTGTYHANSFGIGASQNAHGIPGNCSGNTSTDRTERDGYC